VLTAPIVGSEVGARVLFALDRLEQRLEVALAETQRPVPFDQLEEDFIGVNNTVITER